MWLPYNERALSDGWFSSREFIFLPLEVWALEIIMFAFWYVLITLCSLNPQQPSISAVSNITNSMFIGWSVQEVWLHKFTHVYQNLEVRLTSSYRSTSDLVITPSCQKVHVQRLIFHLGCIFALQLLEEMFGEIIWRTAKILRNSRNYKDLQKNLELYSNKDLGIEMHFPFHFTYGW